MRFQKLPDPRASDVDGDEPPSLSPAEMLAVWRRFWGFVRPYRGKFYLGLLLLLFAVPLSQLSLFLTRDVTNQALLASGLTEGERWEIVLRIVGLQALFWLSSALLSTWREVLEWFTSMRSTFDLRTAFYRHLHRLPLSFLSQRAPGEHLFRSTTDMVSIFRVISRPPTPTASGQSPLDSKEVAIAFYSNDVDPFDPGMMGLITRTTPLLVETLYGLAVGASLLYLIDPVLSLCLAVYIVPFAALSHVAFSRVRKTAFGVKARTEFETGVLRDSIAGLRALKSFGRTRYQFSQYLNAATATRRRSIQQLFQMVLAQNVLQMGMKWAFSLGIYLYVAYRVVQGQATVGDWVATFLLIESAQAPLENFVQILQLVRMQMVPAQRILETLDVEPTLVDVPGAVSLTRVEGAIAFEDVSFSYVEGRRALNGITVSIRPGEYVGIVGPSGAGKSSVVALLLRLYGADAGHVRVDGVDVRDLKLESLLNHVGTVPQATYLYSGTILDNVMFGNPWADETDVAYAIARSGVADFAARLAEGLQTPVGEGATISGGERQRIGVARALLRRPSILILDEATASLDPATEEAILQTVEELRGGRTILSIAHRLKAVARCDRILVMEAGRVVQEGTHAELIEQPGLYQRLWREQSHTEVAA